jgi:hypothetical protein
MERVFIRQRRPPGHRHDGGLDRDLAAIEKQLVSIGEKQTRTARAIAAVDDEDAVAPLIAELKGLAGRKTALEQERDALQRRLDDERTDAAKIAGVCEWCQRVNANLDRLSYDEKRLALEALGVKVRVWREDATDENGNPLPRWELTLAPVSGSEPIAYGDAHSATCAHHSRPSRLRQARRSTRWSWGSVWRTIQRHHRRGPTHYGHGPGR